MSVYYWLIALLLLAALLLRGNEKKSIAFVVAAFLLLFCVMGLRDIRFVGIDSASSYNLNFFPMKNKDWSQISGKGDENYNILFSYLLKLGYVLTNGNYQMFIAAFAAVVLFCYAHFILRYSPSPIQSVLCFLGLLYYSLLFDALKQAIAMAILLLSFDAIVDRRPIRFLLLVLFASGFHFPALVFLPAYWIGGMKPGRNFLLLLAAALALTYVFRDAILNLMLKAYGGDDLEASMDGVRFLRNKVLVMIVMVAAAIVLRPPTEEDTVYNALLMFASVAIVFQTFCGYNNIFERLADYYFHTSIVFIPLVFEKTDRRPLYIDAGTAHTVKTVAPYAFCVFAIYRYLSVMSNSAIYANFRFFWQ